MQPSLPVEGIAVILGNNLTGGRVWRDEPTPPIVTDSPSLPEQADVDKPSKSGNAYLLTVMCQNTRYPAAYPLRSCYF